MGSMRFTILPIGLLRWLSEYFDVAIVFSIVTAKVGSNNNINIKEVQF